MTSERKTYTDEPVQARKRLTTADEFVAAFEVWQIARRKSAMKMGGAGEQEWERSTYTGIDMLLDAALIIRLQRDEIRKLSAAVKSAAQYIEEVTG